MKKVLLLILSVLLFHSCGNEKEPDIVPYLIPDKTNISSIPSSEYDYTVKVISNVDYDVEIDKNCDWLDYEKSEDKIHIKIKNNYSDKDRESFIIIKNEQYNVREIIKISQKGIPSTSGGGNSSIDSGQQTTSGQCAAITKKGTRCKRKAAKGSIYCWQHR